MAVDIAALYRSIRQQNGGDVEVRSPVTGEHAVCTVPKASQAVWTERLPPPGKPQAIRDGGGIPDGVLLVIGHPTEQNADARPMPSM